MPGYINNPQLRKASEKHSAGGLGKPEHEAGGEAKGGSGAHPHSIHIHHASSGAPSAGNPHHVHVHHADGSHEHSDHANYAEAKQHADSKAQESGAPLGEESGAPIDGGEMADGY